ncbi:DUF1648 domain-containing protein [Paenibacillus phocaensis]|uniref:DUF1648 domain-containing protein n=1 Tax=Paenibacillus phocaensis TaxID=1776378 RepID=UPI000839CDAC|nr:DUF5808 domain-containing protein [Paenibacillus phocaensis]
MQLISTFLLLLMFLPLLAALAFMPYLTRETVSFGVSVSEEQYWSPAVRRLRRQFAFTSGTIYTLLLLACVVSLWNKDTNEQGALLGLYIGLTVVLSMGIHLGFYFRMKKMRATLPAVPSAPALIAVDTSFRRQKLALSGKWFLIHVVLILASIALTISHYADIPDPVAMKFDFTGQVVSSAAKSYRVVLFPNVMQLIMTLLFWFVNWSIHHSKQQLQAADPERSLRQNAAFRRRWSVFTLSSSLAMVLMFSFMQINMIRPMDIGIVSLVSLAVPMFIVLFALVLSFTTGQGGSRIGRRPSAVRSGTAPVKDDRYWKLGSIYFNPQDPSLFVEKRSGIGWTLNFANPISWLTLLGILVVIACSAWFAK